MSLENLFLEKEKMENDQVQLSLNTLSAKVNLTKFMEFAFQENMTGLEEAYLSPITKKYSTE
jgi:UDP-N-acetylenolpyruvoylglucosamine reductase